MHTTTRESTDGPAETPATTDSAATTTEPSTETTTPAEPAPTAGPTATGPATPGVSHRSAATEAVSLPRRLPEPETTIYRDSTTVIRLLQTADDAVEVRLYRADDEAVEHIVPADEAASDGGEASDDGDASDGDGTGDGEAASSVDALPEPTRRRFEAAVDAAAERFDRTPRGPGRCRARRPHGARGVLEFGVTIDRRN